MEPASNEKILCVGLCCLDIVMVCESFPKEDSDQRCISHRWQRGGNASNNATVIAEFGIPVEVLGTMGTDVGGLFMQEDFKKHNIIINNCPIYETCDSPISTIWINAENGSRTIVHSNKNMPEIKLKDFKVLNLEDYTWIHFEVRPNVEELKSMIAHVRDWSETHGRSIPISIEIEKPKPELKEMIPLADIVFVSKDFAAACGYASMTDAVENLSLELVRDNSAVICAWGDRGACGRKKDGITFLTQAFPPDEVVNTLGAGDAFVAATIMSLLKSNNLLAAIHMGCKVAGTKCGMHDIQGLAQKAPILQLLSQDLYFRDHEEEPLNEEVD